MIKAVLFDMDGVIFDTEYFWKKAFYEANKKYDLTLGEDFRKTLCGKKEKAIREEMQKMFPDVNINSYRNYTREIYKHLINVKKVPIKRGFLKLIQYLKNNNYPTALVTSSSKDRVDFLFKKSNLDVSKLFDYILTGDQVKIGKPDPFVYTEASKRLGFLPQDCMVIEDSPNGIQSSHSAGCMTIMVVDLIKPTKDLKQMCDNVFYSLNPVLKLIKKYNKC